MKVSDESRRIGKEAVVH